MASVNVEERMEMLFDYVSTDQSLVAGQPVDLLQVEEDGWALVRTEDEQHVWAPRDFIGTISVNHRLSTAMVEINPDYASSELNARQRLQTIGILHAHIASLPEDLYDEVEPPTESNPQEEPGHPNYNNDGPIYQTTEPEDFTRNHSYVYMPANTTEAMYDTVEPPVIALPPLPQHDGGDGSEMPTSVNAWLTSIGMGGYLEAFTVAGFVSLSSCTNIDEDEALNNLCVSDSAHLQHLVSASADLKEKIKTAQAPAPPKAAPRPPARTTPTLSKVTNSPLTPSSTSPSSTTSTSTSTSTLTSATTIYTPGPDVPPVSPTSNINGPPPPPTRTTDTPPAITTDTSVIYTKVPARKHTAETKTREYMMDHPILHKQVSTEPENAEFDEEFVEDEDVEEDTSLPTSVTTNPPPSGSRTVDTIKKKRAPRTDWNQQHQQKQTTSSNIQRGATRASVMALKNKASNTNTLKATLESTLMGGPKFAPPTRVKAAPPPTAPKPKKGAIPQRPRAMTTKQAKLKQQLIVEQRVLEGAENVLSAYGNKKGKRTKKDTESYKRAQYMADEARQRVMQLEKMLALDSS